MKTLFNENHITAYRIQKDLGISEGTVRGWFKGKIPRADHLLKVAEYLHVDPRYLLLGEESYAPSLSHRADMLAEEFAKYGEAGIRFGRESLRLLRTAKNEAPAKSKGTRVKTG